MKKFLLATLGSFLFLLIINAVLSYGDAKNQITARVNGIRNLGELGAFAGDGSFGAN
jgi:hypothetical protein